MNGEILFSAYLPNAAARIFSVGVENFILKSLTVEWIIEFQYEHVFVRNQLDTKRKISGVRIGACDFILVLPATSESRRLGRR